MVGSFSFSVRLPFPMVSFFGYWGAFCVPSGFDGWLFRFRPRFLRSGSSFALFRLNGGLRDSSSVLRSGWSSVFPPSCSRFVFSARSFALRSPSFPMVLVSPSFRFSSSLFPFFSFCLRSPFSSFRSRLRLFPLFLFLDPSYLALHFLRRLRLPFRITPS